MVWELLAYETDRRVANAVRYRAYTQSRGKAKAFESIPKIQHSDSGHGTVFVAHEHSGPREPRVYDLAAYVDAQIHKQRRQT